MERPTVIAINKTDLPDGADMADMVRERLSDREVPVLDISAVSRKGLRELSFLLGELVDRARAQLPEPEAAPIVLTPSDRKSTRLNSSHVAISYAVFCLKK